jgi:hypothetical protein
MPKTMIDLFRYRQYEGGGSRTAELSLQKPSAMNKLDRQSPGSTRLKTR